MNFKTKISKGNFMKENIGQKIKRMRKEMNLTQDNVHHNQSQISQIESGRINNPDQATLETIANNLSLKLDDLIENTDWEKPESPIINTELGFSPAIVDVEIDDVGNISWSHKVYPMFNSKGDKNEFCPKSGMRLITNCIECGRQIEDTSQEYCYGCGHSLFTYMEIHEDISDVLSDNRIFSERDICATSLEYLVSQREYLNQQYQIDIKKVDKIALEQLKNQLQEQKNLVKKIELGMKKTRKKNAKYKDKELDSSLTESRALLKKAKISIDKIDKEIEELEGKKGLVFDQIIWKRFNLQVFDALIRKLKEVVNTLELAPPLTIEEIKLNLYQQLAGLTSQYMNKYLDPFGLMASINDSTESESDEKKINEMEKIEQLTKLMKEVDNTKDPIKIMEIMKDIASNKDQKISNDSNKEKSESAEKSDSSSKVEEKSSNTKKKGA